MDEETRHGEVNISDAPGTTAIGVLRVVHSGAEERRRRFRASAFDGDYVRPIFGDVTSIGRGLHNNVVLLDPAVSREHAVLTRAQDHWSIENISPHNELDVEGHPVAQGEGTALSPGATVRLGKTVLQLLAPAQMDAFGAVATGEDAPHLQQPASDPVATGRAHATADTSGTHLLAPGVTLQFALSGRRSPRVWWAAGIGALLLVIVCVVVTLGTAALAGRDALSRGGPGQILAALTIPLVPALGVTLVVAALDRYEREPWPLLLAAFLWGAIIAIPPVMFIEHALDRLLLSIVTGSGIGIVLMRIGLQALNAGVTEEVMKGAGLVVLLLLVRDEFDNMTDGIIYGLLIGAGFGMVENFVYFALSPRNDLPVLILGRVILGWLSHSTFTAFLGAGLGLARERHGRGSRWRAPLVGLAAAVALHTYFDFVVAASDVIGRSAQLSAGTIVALTTLLAAYGPLFGAQTLLMRQLLAALGREAATVREYLASEVLSGIITPDEYVLLQNATLRQLAERRALFDYGLRACLTARALYQTATGLAFRKWHVAQGDPPKATPRQPEDLYRERIARLKRSLSRQLAAPTPARQITRARL